MPLARKTDTSILSDQYPPQRLTCLPASSAMPNRVRLIATMITMAPASSRLRRNPRAASKRMYLSLAKVVHPPLLVADDLAVLQLDDALAHGVDDALVVSRHHHGRAGPVDALEQLHDVLRGTRVEVPGGLVAEHQQGAVDERACDRDALLLAARQLVREAVSLVVEADELQDLGNSAIDGVAAGADHLEGEGDVLAHGLVGQELEVLEHTADRTTQRRHLPRGEPVQLFAGNPHAARAGPLFLDQQADEGGFAGAGLADDEDELALADVH